MDEGLLGINAAAESLYRNLMTRTSWGIADLAEFIGEDPDLLRPGIDALIADGLVVASADEVDAVRPVEPCLALPALAHRRILNNDFSRVPRPDAVSRMVTIHESTDVRIADGSHDRLTTVVERLICRSGSDVTFLVGAWAPRSFAAAQHLVTTVVRRGVRVRALWAQELAGEPDAVAHGRWLQQQGVTVRITRGKVPRAVMVDGIVNNFPPGRDQRSAAHGPAEAEVERVWQRSADLHRPQLAGDDSRPGHRRDHVLRLLADGLTDDTIARQLGVSVRTVRSDVATTMTHLQAQSRFQAGVRALQLGLI